MNDITKIILAIGILLILIAILMPVFSYRTWFEWWKINDPNGEYNCFPLVKMAYYSNSIFLYRFINMCGSGPSQIKYDWWFYLFNGFMEGAAVGIAPGGYATPKSFCKSLIPTDFPSKTLETTYTAGTIPSGLNTSGKCTGIPLPSSANSWDGKSWPDNNEDWRIVLANWGKITFCTGGGEQIYYVDPDNTWYTDTDNFLATWGIPPDSPIVIGFITGWDMYNDDKTYVRALYPLLGLTEGGAGGWWGFLQYGDDFGGDGLMEVNRIVWSEIVPASVGEGISKSTNGCNKGAAVSGAMGGAGVGAMIGSAAAGPSLGLSVVLGALIGGLASAGANNCL